MSTLGAPRYQDPTARLAVEDVKHVLELALRSPEKARLRFPGCRLSDIVKGRLCMYPPQVDALALLAFTETGAKIVAHPLEDRCFEMKLQQTIARHRLERLFVAPQLSVVERSTLRSVSCLSINITEKGKSRWRAEYRVMSAVRQMLAASIIWLAAAGSEIGWLDQVSCSWLAADGVESLRRADAFEDWIQLIQLFPHSLESIS